MPSIVSAVRRALVLLGLVVGSAVVAPVGAVPAGALRLAARQSANCSAPASRFQPDLYEIQPAQPSVATNASQLIHLAVTSSTSSSNGSSVDAGEVQQVVVFRGLPATAVNCSLHWAVAAIRNFTVDSNGLVSVVALPSVPVAPVSAASIQPLLAAAVPVGGADFTNWPLVTGAHTHNVGQLACQSDLALHVSINRMAGDVGAVHLAQSAVDGWFVNYAC